MSETSRVHSHCPTCERPVEWMVGASYWSCPCGEQRRKLRVALPLGYGEQGEKLWAKPSGEGLYVIDNVPLSALGLNAEDVVRAVVPTGRPEQIPEVVEVVRSGGQSTVWLRFTEVGEPEADAFFASLPEGLDRERLRGMHALGVPASLTAEVGALLEAAKSQGLLTFMDNRPSHADRFDDPSDDLLGEAYGELQLGTALPAPDALEPMSDEELDADLWRALGWADERPRPEHFHLRLLTSADVRQRSKGAVTLPRTINPRTYAPKHMGLFAPEIWGHAAGPSPEGLRASYGDRDAPTRSPEGYYALGGHIELPLTVSHPWFRDRSHPCVHVDALLVLPPGLRPVFALDDGRIAIADVNYHYMRLIDLTHRADVTQAALQAAVEALFMNEAFKPPTTLAGRRLSSLFAQLARDPATRLAELDAVLGAGDGSRSPDGELPGDAFNLVRQLEAYGIAVEARSRG